MVAWGSLLIALAAVLWSTDALFRLPLTRDLSALAIVFAEHFLALVFVLPILWLQRSLIVRLTARQWLAVGFIGLGASALATLAFTASFNYVSPSVSILLQKTQPLVTFSLAWFILRERLPRNFFRWACLALLGAYLVSFPEVIPTVSFYQQGTVGVLLALGAAALWGSATVFGRYLLNDVPPPLVTALRFIVALPFLAWLLSFNHGFGSLVSISVRDFWYLVIIMLGPGFGAMYLYYRGLRVTRASVSAVLELIWPLAAVVLNWIFLGAGLSLIQIAGGILLLSAIGKLTVWQRPQPNSQPNISTSTA